eukprot:g18893.t1
MLGMADRSQPSCGGADKDAVDDGGSTPLMLAATKGHVVVVSTLLGAGADTSVRNRAAGTALLYAAFAGHREVLCALLAGGADTEARTHDGNKSLILAAYHGFVFAVGVVLPAGENVDAVGNRGDSALNVAAFKCHLPVVESLGAADANPNVRSTGAGHAALHYAAEKGHDEIVCTLLRNGADKDGRANNGTTPTWTAAAKGCISVVHILAAAGSNANLPNTTGGSVPLHHVADGGHHEAVSFLSRKGVDVDALDSPDMSPLAWAARLGHVLVVERETALHKAVKKQHPDAVEALVKAGAYLELRTDRQVTRLLAAARGLKFDAMVVLLEHGAAINVRHEKGNVPFHLVCRGQRQRLELAIDLLLLRGADKKISNSHGHAPADLLDVGAAYVFRRCSDDEREGARRLLSRASANRAWDRRGWLLTLRARGAGGGRWGGGAEQQAEGLSGMVSMLLAMALEDVFRTTVSFV